MAPVGWYKSDVLIRTGCSGSSNEGISPGFDIRDRSEGTPWAVEALLLELNIGEPADVDVVFRASPTPPSPELARTGSHELASSGELITWNIMTAR